MYVTPPWLCLLICSSSSTLIVYMDLTFLCFDVILFSAMTQKKSKNSKNVRTLAPSSKPTKPPTSPKRLSSVKAG